MRRMRSQVISLGLLLLLSGACGAPSGSGGSGSAPPEERQTVTPEEAAAIEADIRALLEEQAGAWNEGDLVRFVADYLDSPRMRFVSGGSVRGSEDVLDRYRRTYPDRAAMGVLTFTDLDVRVLTDEYVFVFGRYNLERENDAPTGLFTLLFERTGDGWKISHDHTSSH